MKLVDPKDLLKANESLNWFGGESFAKLLMYILRLNKLNDLYSANCCKDGIEFIDALIEDLGIKFEFDEEELKEFLWKEDLLPYQTIRLVELTALF